MKPSASVGRFPFAGALRAIATLTIVFYHCWVTAWNTHRITWSSQACVMLGEAGVACFFALSGFLLGRRYVAALLARKPLPRWQDFARDRFLRIYPLYAFLVIAFSLGTAWLGVPGEHPATFVDTIAHLTFVFPFFRYTALSIDPPMWTMSTDVQFYIALPLIAVLIALLVRHRRSVSVLLGTLVGALILASIALRVVAWPLAMPSFNDFGLRVAVFGMMPTMFTAFGMGILGVFVWERFPNDRKRFGLIAAVIGAVLWWFTLTNSPGITRYVVWSDVLAGASAGFILFAGCALLDFPVVENPVVRWAERLSYGVYLIHFFVIEYIVIYFTGHLTGNTFLFATFALSYAAALLVALPLYLAVERPFLNIKSRLSKRSAALPDAKEPVVQAIPTH